MTVDLAALLKLSQEATPGPWLAKEWGGDATVWKANGSHMIVGDAIYHPENVATAAYIAAASPDVVAALVRVALAAQAAVDRAEADDDFDGQYVDWLVPDEAIAALRAALEALR